MRRNFTLLEIIITTVMLAVLAGVSVYFFHAVLKVWSHQEEEIGSQIPLFRAIKEVVQDLREAKEVKELNDDEIRFCKNSDFYIYYLFNEKDTYPPRFNQDFYKLKKAKLSNNINGGFSYGSGQILLDKVLPPPLTDLSVDNEKMVIVDLRVSTNEEVKRLRAKIKPRNISY
jgi:hypothetical protein